MSIFSINPYCESYISHAIETKLISYYLSKHVLWAEEMIYKVKFSLLKSTKESLLMFSLSSIWSCLLFTAEKAATQIGTMPNNKGASTYRLNIKRQCPWINEQIFATCRLIAKFCRALLDSINTPLAVKYYLVFLDKV